MSDAAVSLRIY